MSTSWDCRALFDSIRDMVVYGSLFCFVVNYEYYEMPRLNVSARNEVYCLQTVKKGFNKLNFDESCVHDKTHFDLFKEFLNISLIGSKQR